MEANNRNQTGKKDDDLINFFDESITPRKSVSFTQLFDPLYVPNDPSISGGGGRGGGDASGTGNALDPANDIYSSNNCCEFPQLNRELESVASGANSVNPLPHIKVPEFSLMSGGSPVMSTTRRHQQQVRAAAATAAISAASATTTTSSSSSTSLYPNIDDWFTEFPDDLFPEGQQPKQHSQQSDSTLISTLTTNRGENEERPGLDPDPCLKPRNKEGIPKPYYAEGRRPSNVVLLPSKSENLDEASATSLLHFFSKTFANEDLQSQIQILSDQCMEAFKRREQIIVQSTQSSSSSQGELTFSQLNLLGLCFNETTEHCWNFPCGIRIEVHLPHLEVLGDSSCASSRKNGDCLRFSGEDLMLRTGKEMLSEPLTRLETQLGFKSRFLLRICGRWEFLRLDIPLGHYQYVQSCCRQFCSGRTVAAFHLVAVHQLVEQYQQHVSAAFDEDLTDLSEEFQKRMELLPTNVNKQSVVDEFDAKFAQICLAHRLLTEFCRATTYPIPIEEHAKFTSHLDELINALNAMMKLLGRNSNSTLVQLCITRIDQKSRHTMSAMEQTNFMRLIADLWPLILDTLQAHLEVSLIDLKLKRKAVWQRWVDECYESGGDTAAVQLALASSSQHSDNDVIDDGDNVTNYARHDKNPGGWTGPHRSVLDLRRLQIGDGVKLRQRKDTAVTAIAGKSTLNEALLGVELGSLTGFGREIATKFSTFFIRLDLYYGQRPLTNIGLIPWMRANNKQAVWNKYAAQPTSIHHAFMPSIIFNEKLCFEDIPLDYIPLECSLNCRLYGSTLSRNDSNVDSPPTRTLLAMANVPLFDVNQYLMQGARLVPLVWCSPTAAGTSSASGGALGASVGDAQFTSSLGTIGTGSTHTGPSSSGNAKPGLPTGTTAGSSQLPCLLQIRCVNLAASSSDSSVLLPTMTSGASSATQLHTVLPYRYVRLSENRAVNAATATGDPNTPGHVIGTMPEFSCALDDFPLQTMDDSCDDSAFTAISFSAKREKEIIDVLAEAARRIWMTSNLIGCEPLGGGQYEEDSKLFWKHRQLIFPGGRKDESVFASRLGQHRRPSLLAQINAHSNLLEYLQVAFMLAVVRHVPAQFDTPSSVFRYSLNQMSFANNIANGSGDFQHYSIASALRLLQADMPYLPCRQFALGILRHHYLERHRVDSMITHIPSILLLVGVESDRLHFVQHASWCRISSLLLDCAIQNLRFANALFWQLQNLASASATCQSSVAPNTSGILPSDKTSGIITEDDLTGSTGNSQSCLEWNWRFGVLLAALEIAMGKGIRKIWTIQQTANNFYSGAALAVKANEIASGAYPSVPAVPADAAVGDGITDITTGSTGGGGGNTHETRMRTLMEHLNPLQEIVRWSENAKPASYEQDSRTWHTLLMPNWTNYRVPYQPGLIPSRLNLKRSAFFNSNNFPLKIQFDAIRENCQTAAAGGGTLANPSSVYSQSTTHYSIIFKSGDDLRQDMFVLQLFQLMDSIWLRSGLDLRMLLFKVLDTSVASPITKKFCYQGLIEMVDDCATLKHIQEAKAGVTAPLTSRNSIRDWLRFQNPERTEYRDAVDNFLRSSAGFCVATYLLGIGDRHNDNILVKYSGHLLHIDFAKLLGDRQTFAGISRDRVAFVLTAEMLRVMEDWERTRNNSTDVIDPRTGIQFFIDLCCQALNILRQSAFEIISMLQLNGQMGITGVNEKTITFVIKNLRLNESDLIFSQYFTELIYRSAHSFFTKLNFFVHSLAQAKFSHNSEAGEGGGSDGGGLFSFTPRTFRLDSDDVNSSRILSASVVRVEKRMSPSRHYMYILRVQRDTKIKTKTSVATAVGGEEKTPPIVVERRFEHFIELAKLLRQRFPAHQSPLPNICRPILSVTGTPNSLESAQTRIVFLQELLDNLLTQLSDEICQDEIMHTFLCVGNVNKKSEAAPTNAASAQSLQTPTTSSLQEHTASNQQIHLEPGTPAIQIGFQISTGTPKSQNDVATPVNNNNNNINSNNDVNQFQLILFVKHLINLHLSQADSSVVPRSSANGISGTTASTSSSSSVQTVPSSSPSQSQNSSHHQHQGTRQNPPNSYVKVYFYHKDAKTKAEITKNKLKTDVIQKNANPTFNSVISYKFNASANFMQDWNLSVDVWHNDGFVNMCLYNLFIPLKCIEHLVHVEWDPNPLRAHWFRLNHHIAGAKFATSIFENCLCCNHPQNREISLYQQLVREELASNDTQQKSIIGWKID